MSDPGTELAIPDDEVGIETVELEVFGEPFKILKAMNSFNLMRVFDADEPAELSKYLIKAVASTDRRRFITVMAQQINLSMDDLFKIFSDMIEAQSNGRPTKPSSESSTGSRKKAVSTRSVAT
jgi:hypothetical protein